jgi:hypothetical protein
MQHKYVARVCLVGKETLNWNAGEARKKLPRFQELTSELLHQLAGQIHMRFNKIFFILTFAVFLL